MNKKRKMHNSLKRKQKSIISKVISIDEIVKFEVADEKRKLKSNLGPQEKLLDLTRKISELSKRVDHILLKLDCF